MKSLYHPLKIVLLLIVFRYNCLIGQFSKEFNKRISQYPFNTIMPFERDIANYKIMQFTIDQYKLSFSTDAATFINNFIDSVSNLYPDTSKIIILPNFSIKINKPIVINHSNVVLQGDVDFTKIIINNGENHGIIIQPKNYQPISFKVLEKIRKDTNIIYVDSSNYNIIKNESEKGYRVLTIRNNDDNNLITSSWAKGTIKEHFEIIGMGKISKNKYFIRLGYSEKKFGFKFRMNPFLNYSEDTLKTSFYIENPIYNSGISCLKIFRLDSTIGQTSNIMIKNASQCVVKAVKSYKTNFSHITLENSKFCVVKRCYFSNSHGFGGGGRGYGVTIHLGGSSNSILYNYADTLRHSFLLQAGANRNVIYGNYSTKAFWYSVPQDAAGDMVLHGNYVFNNLIEKNVFENIVLDNSHGKNGPNNVFFRNISTNYGLVMSSANGSDSQVFVGNEITNTSFLKGLFVLQDKGHLVYGNKVKGSLNPANTDQGYVTSIFIYTPDKNMDSIEYPILKIDYGWQPIAGWPYIFYEDLESRKMKDVTNKNCLDMVLDAGVHFTEISNIKQIDSILFYPNPANNYVVIKNFKGTVKIFNILGIELSNERLTEKGENLINLSAYHSGLYLVNFYDENGVLIKVERLVKYD